MKGNGLRGEFGVRESLNVRHRGLGGVKKVREGPNFGQRWPGVFGLPFKNRFRFGLRRVKGLWLRNKLWDLAKRMIHLTNFEPANFPLAQRPTFQPDEEV